MNRKHRRSLILFPLSLGVVGVFVGREMASWRPVKLVELAPFMGASPMRASGNYVSVTTGIYPSSPSSASPVETICTRLEVRGGKVSVARYPGEQGAGTNNNFFWHLKFALGYELSYNPFKMAPNDSTINRLEVRNDLVKRTFVYRSKSRMDYDPNIQVLPKQNRVVLLTAGNVVEWDYRTARLKHQHEIASENESLTRKALSGDARSFVLAGAKGFQIGDVATGVIRHRIAFRGVSFFDFADLSPHGQYGLLDQRAKTPRMEVVQSATGKRLWGFDSHGGVPGGWTIPDDEKTIFVRTSDGWQVRDLQSGAVLRELPLIPNSFVCVPSPDGSLLYSVAKGALYRQRAR